MIELSRTFDSGDGLLAYRDAGAGRPLVLLHASFVDSMMFNAQLPVLARRYRVIAPDARGHGESANATRPFRQTDDLAALLRHLDLGPAVLIGVSMGAMIAVDTALEHPDLVRALVVSGRAIGEPEYRDPWSKELDATQARAMAHGDIDTWMTAFVQWAAGPRRSLDEVDATMVSRIREMAARTLAKHTASEPDHHIPVAAVAARAAAIEVPVLAADGAFDSPDLTATVDRLLAAVPGSRREIITGAGHFPNMEQPDAYNRIIEDFVGGLR
ncbi:alpha/beta fold hydrolase [Nocardia sp. NPDC057440]|uniref:alpha/beta fold hydrolase n=1 Tax=Nocardia sp. NPDC057440 TaxID=3346134 RepID=UPI00366E652C